MSLLQYIVGAFMKCQSKNKFLFAEMLFPTLTKNTADEKVVPQHEEFTAILNNYETSEMNRIFDLLEETDGDYEALKGKVKAEQTLGLPFSEAEDRHLHCQNWVQNDEATVW